MSSKFYSGCLATVAYLSLSQDYYGKEEYIRRVSMGWVDGSITIPLALILLVVSLILYHND